MAPRDRLSVFSKLSSLAKYPFCLTGLRAQTAMPCRVHSTPKNTPTLYEPLLSLMLAVTWAAPCVAPCVAPFARMACGLAIRRGLAEYVPILVAVCRSPAPTHPSPPRPGARGVWRPRCLPRRPMLLLRPASSAECLCTWLCSILPLFWALSVVRSPGYVVVLYTNIRVRVYHGSHSRVTGAEPKWCAAERSPTNGVVAITITQMAAYGHGELYTCTFQVYLLI